MDDNEPKRRTYLQWVLLGSGLHLGVLFILVAGMMGYIVLQSTLRQTRYEPVQGKILRSIAEPCPDGMFTPVIAFSYTVDRRRYNTGKYRDDFGDVCLNKAEVEQILAQYPPGSTIEAWYDPQQPQLAVIDRSMGMLQYGYLIVMSGFVVIFSLAWWFRRGTSADKSAQ